MTENSTGQELEQAPVVEHNSFWIAPTVLRRATEFNAQIESQLAIRAATVLPFVKSLSRLGFVRA